MDKNKKQLLGQDVKDAIGAEVNAEFAGKTKEEIKTAIAANSAKAQENEDANNASIALYRARANESRVLREKNRVLRSLLTADKKVEKVADVIGFMDESQLADLIAAAQTKLAEKQDPTDAVDAQ